MLQHTCGVFSLKLRHIMLCTGNTPQSVDARLGKRAGWTRRVLHRLQNYRSVRLEDISDIAFACGVELIIDLVKEEA